MTNPDFGPAPQSGNIWPRIRRGLRLRCPRCGEGKLFRAYLKPVENCESCGQRWGDKRADLAPAWAAMTLASHIALLVWHFGFWHSDLPNWQLISGLSALVIVISLLLLPPMKGLFLAIIWSKGTTDS
jgi:uncharacterized protein (DUF983 family)